MLMIINPPLAAFPALVVAAVNHLGTVFPVVKLASIHLGGCVLSRFGRVYWEAAEPSSFARGVNPNTPPVLQALKLC